MCARRHGAAPRFSVSCTEPSDFAATYSRVSSVRNALWSSSMSFNCVRTRRTDSVCCSLHKPNLFGVEDGALRARPIRRENSQLWPINAFFAYCVALALPVCKRGGVQVFAARPGKDGQPQATHVGIAEEGTAALLHWRQQGRPSGGHAGGQRACRARKCACSGSRLDGRGSGGRRQGWCVSILSLHVHVR